MRAEERLSVKPIPAFKPAEPGHCRGGRETPGYRARAPGSPLSRIVLNNLQEFGQWLKNPPDLRPPCPQSSVISTLEKFIECGVMRYGAVRFRCPGCGGNIFVALSCKRRGCPNCDAKRSAIITGQALERLLAFVPYRQWVLVVPKRLRYFLNHNPALAGELSRIFAGEINRFLCQNATGTPAQLHFIQRFGGALNLHIHVHAVVSDGVFNLKMNVLGRNEVVFTPVPCPTDGQLAAIVTAVRKRFIRRVRRACGLSQEAAENLLSWKNSGFSIHEEVLIKDWDRKGLERLIGYCSRAALSQKRLVYAEKANTGEKSLLVPFAFGKNSIALQLKMDKRAQGKGGIIER